MLQQKWESFFLWKVSEEDPLCLDIRRDFVQHDAMREAEKMFCVEKLVKVSMQYSVLQCIL